MTDDDKALAKLREPFAENEIGKLPKQLSKNDQDRGKCERGSRYSADGNYCGGYHARSIHLDYVGHAAITKRLLEADPHWYYEPLSFGPDGLPVRDEFGGLWIRLTVAGMTRLGYGDAQGKPGPNGVKEAIGDALRNAGMRFGMALDLWHKGDLYENEREQGKAPEQAQQNGQRPQQGPPARDWLKEAEAVKGNVDALKQLWREAKAFKASPQILKQIEGFAKPQKQRDFIAEIDDAGGNIDALRSLHAAAQQAGDETAVHVIGDAIDSEMDRQGR